MSVTQFYYEIKRYGDESVLVSPKVGAAVAEAKATGKESVVIKKDGTDMLIDCKSISAVEQSTIVMPDRNIYLLSDGNDGSEKPSAAIDLDGNVIVNWYKKAVSIKQWEGHFRHIPAYQLLQNDGNGCWVAFRKPEMYNDLSRNDNLFPCNEDEVRMLDHKLEQR